MNATAAAEPHPPAALVVEDDSATRVMLVRLLEKEGFTVNEAENGRLALEQFSAHAPAVVLMDVLMPEMDGFDACEAIRRQAHFGDVAVLMLTSLGDTESIERAFDVGATDFNQKPINPALLRQRVRYALRMQRLHGEARLNEARLAQAQRVARVAHWEYQVSSGLFYWSAPMRRLLGLEQERDSGWLEPYIPAAERDTVLNDFYAMLREGNPFTIEHQLQMPDGQSRSVLVRSEPMASGDQWIGTLQDITDIRQTEARLHYVTRFDEVTRLPNRSTLINRLREAIRRADDGGHRVGLLVFTLERFRSIQEILGKEYADGLARAAADRLFAHLGPRATIARVRDDEFAILTGPVDDGQAVTDMAKDVSGLMGRPLNTGSQTIYAQASVGMALYPDHAREAPCLLRHARSAMRCARQADHTAYCLYRAEMNTAAMHEIELERDLHEAVSEAQFHLVYQPKWDAHCRELIGFEALVRWDHPERGLVSPGDFIPVLESTGLIAEVDRWVMMQAARQCEQWRRRSTRALSIAINVSAERLSHPSFLEDIDQAIAGDVIQPECLELEITETVALDDLRASRRILEALRARGFRIAIDDFGTGSSSLTRLRHFPADAVKIDSSFVFNMHQNDQDASIVRHSIELAHDLGMSVVAEGIEIPAHVEMLQQMACDSFQGFHLGQPMSAGDAESLIG